MHAHHDLFGIYRLQNYYWNLHKLSHLVVLLLEWTGWTVRKGIYISPTSIYGMQCNFLPGNLTQVM